MYKYDNWLKLHYDFTVTATVKHIPLAKKVICFKFPLFKIEEFSVKNETLYKVQIMLIKFMAQTHENLKKWDRSP